MSESRIFVKSRRRFWTYTTLIFLAGVIVGLLFGVFGLRYLVFRFPPHRDDIVAKTVGRIRNDYDLDAETAKALEEECNRFFTDTRARIDATRERIDLDFQEHMQNIARIFPDEAKQRRWLEEYPNYFPRGLPRPPLGLFPPPPPPYSPPPPPKGQ